MKHAAQFCLFLFAGLLSAQAAFEERAQFIIDRLASEPVGGSGGKLPMGTAIAHLALTEGMDEAARNYLTQIQYGNDSFFNANMHVRAVFMAREHLTSAQRSLIQAIATNPDMNWNNNGTENHRLMTWASGYLFAQFFPNGQWRYGSETIGSAELMSRLRERIIEVGRNEYRAGYSEFLSPNYEIYHVSPMLNLHDYAEDPEIRAIAEAFLSYHFGLLALGSFQEIVLPPWSRKAGEMDVFITGASTQWILWLFWGHGTVESTRQMDPTDPIVFFAVSDWRPPAVFDDIATRVVEFPYTARMQQTHFEWNPTRYVMRTTYQEEKVAMSSGVVRHIPGAFQLDDSQFMIAWDGTAAIRNILAFHPYWRPWPVDNSEGGENYWGAPTSPFMQTGQHENTAIMLFDILAEDPWPTAGRFEWYKHRQGPVIPLAQVRFPSYLSYASADDWSFVRDGPVYIGIQVPETGLDPRTEDLFRIQCPPEPRSRGRTLADRFHLRGWLRGRIRLLRGISVLRSGQPGLRGLGNHDRPLYEYPGR